MPYSHCIIFKGGEMMNNSISGDYIDYILEKWAQLRNYVARLTAFLCLFGVEVCPKLNIIIYKS